MAYRCRVLFDFVAEDETSELTVRRGEVVQVSPGEDGVYGTADDTKDGWLLVDSLDHPGHNGYVPQVHALASDPGRDSREKARSHPFT